MLLHMNWKTMFQGFDVYKLIKDITSIGKILLNHFKILNKY